MMRRFRFTAAVVVAALVVGAGCGGADDGPAAPTGRAGGPGFPAVSGGSATVLQPIDASSLDPTTVVNSPSVGSSILPALYDVLFTVDSHGNLTGRLATGFSTDDGTTWTMQVRPDVRFSDGTPFDAEAVRSQWERIKGNIRGSGWASFQQISSMAVLDPLTLQVVLANPNRQFHHHIDNSAAVYIPSPTAMATEGDGFTNRPVGAGPFVLRSRTPNTESVLDRNPDFWEDGHPKLDTLVLRTVIDPQQAYDTLTTGGADAWTNTPDHFAADAADAGYTLLATEQIGGAGWLFGTKRPPFDDVRARRAVYLALDMDQLDETVVRGRGDVPRTLFPESSPFHNPDIAFPEADAVEAQRLLDELAAEGRPVRFTIIAPGGDSLNRANGLQTQLAEFDHLDVSVANVDGPTYGPTLYSGDFDLAVFGFGGPDPEPALGGMRSDAPIPIASMGSAAVDQAIEQGRTAVDEAGRRVAYDELARQINDLYKVKWMNRNHVWFVESPEVTGITTYGQGTPLFHAFGRVA